MKYYDWQIKCLRAWVNNNCRGIVNVVTGAGKTAFALSAIEHLEEAHRKLRVKIIVPQTFLLSQWAGEIIGHLGVRREEVGLFGGSRKDVGKKYTIYVINSARNVLSEHISEDIRNGYSVLLIADECHHYTSEKNIEAFNFYGLLPVGSAYFSLGLSATPKTDESITDPLGGEIFKYGFIDALNAQIISKFVLFNMSVSFNDGEALEYEYLTENLTNCLAKLKKLCPELKRLSGDSFFARLQKLSVSPQNPTAASLAANVLTLSYQRKSVVHLAENRVACAVGLIKRSEPQSKIIIFCERIETARCIFSLIEHSYPVGIYHSGMEQHNRKQALERYRNGDIRILISCKALDEGLNVPSTDLGIIVSSSSSLRQRTQRLGRVLRRSETVKRFYYLFVDQSAEDKELISELSDTLAGVVPMIDLSFRGGSFRYPEYEALCSKVMAHVEQTIDDNGVLSELRNNLELGAVRLDWWKSEDFCRKRISAATTKTERNYWISVLYAVLERLGRLC